MCSPPVSVEKKVRTYLRSIVSSSAPNETAHTAASAPTTTYSVLASSFASPT
jgi:hypothetical protein